MKAFLKLILIVIALFIPFAFVILLVSGSLGGTTAVIQAYFGDNTAILFIAIIVVLLYYKRIKSYLLRVFSNLKK